MYNGREHGDSDKEVEAMKVGSAGSSYYQTLYQQTKTTNENATKLIMRGDSLNLSQAGLAISLGKLNVPDVPTAAPVEETNAALRDPTVRALKKAFEDMTRGLSEMKQLAEMALDPELTDLERIDLQIEMTKLQSRLFKDAHRLGLDLYPGAEGYTNIENALNVVCYEEDKMLAFLEQAKERIANGEYERGRGGIDISSVSVYIEPEPAPSLLDIVLDPEREDEVWPADKGSLRESEATNRDGEPLEPIFTGVDINFETLGQVAVTQVEQVEPVLLVALENSGPRSGGTLTKLSFKDRRISPDRLDEALHEIAGQTWNMETGILLTDLKSAILSVERIEKQMEELEEFKAEFANLVQNMPPEGYAGKGIEEEPLEWLDPDTSVNKSSLALVQEEYTTAFNNGTSSIVSSNKPMQREGEPERPSPTTRHDYRMRNPRNPLEAFAQKVDAFFKDKLFKKLGYSMKLETNEDM